MEQFEMCGILAAFGASIDGATFRACAATLSARGPEDACECQVHGNLFAFHRLAVSTASPSTGQQPFVSPSGNLCIANGEIYNHRQLGSVEVDCDCILSLYEEHGVSFIDALDGMFAFVIYDVHRRRVLIARDHVGIIPLYWAHGNNQLWIASEMKALPSGLHVEFFPPGCFFCAPPMGKRQVTKWYDPRFQADVKGDETYMVRLVRSALVASCRQMVDCPTKQAYFLSGGLDSAIVAAICAQLLGCTPATFAIGLQDAPDAAMARKLAIYGGYSHTDVTFTVEEGIGALSRVIKAIETYDVTTVRSSVPQYLLSKVIAGKGFKSVFSGEGADELFAGYLYFEFAPDAQALHQECTEKVSKLHLYDCLRSNKATAAHGLECRVPFLSKHVIAAAFTMDASFKHPQHYGIEKGLLRQAFSDILPDFIRTRRKVQFSDGVSSAWITALKAAAQTNGFASEKEWYKSIFHQYYPTLSHRLTVPEGKSIACSTEQALSWAGLEQVEVDPSGAALSSLQFKGGVGLGDEATEGP